MQASQRLDRFGAEVFASLNNKLLALKAQGKTIYNMSVGTPDFKPYDHVVEALMQAAQDPEMWKYALRDLPELKQAVCDYYERRFGVSGITPSMVQSCNGTQEGVGHLGLALLDPGDTILVPDPCYPVFEAGAKIADAKLEYYPLVAEHNYLCGGYRSRGGRSCQVYDCVAARQPGRLGGHARGLRRDHRFRP